MGIGVNRQIYCMKKLILLSTAMLLGAASASYAGGVHFSVGIGLPLPGFVIGSPAPAPVYAPAPNYYPPAPVYAPAPPAVYAPSPTVVVAPPSFYVGVGPGWYGYPYRYGSHYWHRGYGGYHGHYHH